MDLIALSNDCEIEYTIGAGALGFDGRGWLHEKILRDLGIVDLKLFVLATKTFTLSKNQGNVKWSDPFRCLRLMPGGLLNAVGLYNPGIEYFCRRIGPFIDRGKFRLILSLAGTPEELAIMARMVSLYELVAIEIDGSCPCNLKDTAEIIASCEAVKANTDIPVILKLSVTHDASQIGGKIKNTVEALSINSVPWAVVFPNKKSPLEKFGGGGISGKIAQPFTWAFAKKLMELTDIPPIIPSIWDFEDITRARNLVPNRDVAISFGSVHFYRPWFPTQCVRRERKGNII